MALKRFLMLSEIGEEWPAESQNEMDRTAERQI